MIDSLPRVTRKQTTYIESSRFPRLMRHFQSVYLNYMHQSLCKTFSWMEGGPTEADPIAQRELTLLSFQSGLFGTLMDLEWLVVCGHASSEGTSFLEIGGGRRGFVTGSRRLRSWGEIRRFWSSNVSAEELRLEWDNCGIHPTPEGKILWGRVDIATLRVR